MGPKYTQPLSVKMCNRIVWLVTAGFMYICLSFASEDDQDFISQGGGVCAEMADQADLRPKKSVAVGTGDVRG